MSSKSYTYSQVVDAVLRCGPDKWYHIGLKLGYTDGEITSATDGKPTHAGKLQAIINLKTSAVGEKELAKLLLKACANIPHPIIGQVKQYLDPTYDPKAVVGTVEGFASGIQKPGAASLVQPTTGTSEADQMVEVDEIVKIAEAIEGFWDDFAVRLDPRLFTMAGSIQAIKRNQNFPSPNSKAQFMLETWRDGKGTDATRRLLIETLCKMNKVKQSNDVFGESLTDSVRQHKTDVSDGPLPPDKQTDPVTAKPGPGNGTASVKAKATPTVAGDKIDVLVITATETERKAVTEVLKHIADSKQVKVRDLHYSGARELGCTVATWTPSKRLSMTVGLVQQTKMGTDGVSDILTAIRDAEQKGEIAKNALVAMIGMCAGNQDEVNLGDVLVPWEIALEADGGKQTRAEYQVDAKYAKLRAYVQTAVQSVAMATALDQTQWLGYIPEKFRGTPSPRNLLDVTLFELQNWEPSDHANAKELNEHLKKKYKWPDTIEMTTIKEVIKHYQSLKYVECADAHQVHFKVSKEGEKYIKRQHESQPEFPRPDPTPAIRHGLVVMGHKVDVTLETPQAWKQKGATAGKRKPIGYEMEGHTFLETMTNWHESMASIFIKAVADFGTEEYKMHNKYYQEYATTVAAAFLFHFLAVKDPSTWQPSS